MLLSISLCHYITPNTSVIILTLYTNFKCIFCSLLHLF
nr:MAG TPA: 4Fe-4S single cluster domain protein [Caudoviricetes sp.]